GIDLHAHRVLRRAAHRDLRHAVDHRDARREHVFRVLVHLRHVEAVGGEVDLDDRLIGRVLFAEGGRRRQRWRQQRHGGGDRRQQAGGDWAPDERLGNVHGRTSVLLTARSAATTASAALACGRTLRAALASLISTLTLDAGARLPALTSGTLTLAALTCRALT